MPEHTPLDEETQLEEDWPDVVIAALLPVRVMAQPVPRSASDEDEINWHIYSELIDEGERSVAMTGDMFIQKDGWQVAASAVAFLTFREPLDKSAEGIDNVTRKYGRWASHSLWDLVIQQARTASAGLAGGPVDIPQGTPEPHLVFSQPGPSD